MLYEGLLQARFIDVGPYSPDVVSRVGRHPLKPVIALPDIGSRDDTPVRAIPMLEQDLEWRFEPRTVDSHGPDAVGPDRCHIKKCVNPLVGAWDHTPLRAVPVLNERFIVRVILVVGRSHGPSVLLRDGRYPKENVVL